jgi:transposase
MYKYDYTGKTIYMGIDVHKKTYSCVSICEGEVIKRDTMPAKPEVLLSYIHNHFQGAEVKTAYEAGFSGFHLHRFLLSHGIKNQVVHPGAIEVASRDRVKTDKRDALKIATQLASHRLKGIFVPTVEQEGRRSVTRLRQQIWQSRQRIGNQLKGLLFTQGLMPVEDDTRISACWILKKLNELSDIQVPEDLKYSIHCYAQEWQDLTRSLKMIEEQLKNQAQEDGLTMIYESVPGIGLLHGRELANELGDMSQFKNEKRLFSFLGLTPSEYSSGEHVRQGNISRQGRSIFRKIFIEAAWVAIRQDPNLKEIYDRLSAHRGKKRAIVAVARHLAGRIRACIRTGCLYEKRAAIKDQVKQQQFA